jgi:alpha-galactosidase
MQAIRRALLALAMVAAATFAVAVATPTPASALNNGLAKTPPMGWNDWNAFGCGVSEALVEQTAAYIVSSGLKAAGYQYVNIDDCWMSSSRSSTGHLVPDPTKFPDGISGVANYVHGLGLNSGSTRAPVPRPAPAIRAA